MRSEDITKAVRTRMASMGVPKHVYGIEKEPPRVKIRVLIGGKLVELYVFANTTRDMLDAKLNEIENRWREHTGVQSHIEGKR